MENMYSSAEKIRIYINNNRLFKEMLNKAEQEWKNGPLTDLYKSKIENKTSKEK
ncbi:hypothetical protein KY314_04150 [Candidatus Woesearchaeota archaeon]|nr:hypothetical protein [Candidatus Woesearchaeota archaeon]